MTIQHPLTEEIMYKLHRPHAGYSDPFCDDDMRAAADWQLEQVIEWLKNNLDPSMDIMQVWENKYAINDYRVIANLKKAMRPQQQEDS